MGFEIPMNCTGCSACSVICPNDCITMEIREDSFIYPRVDNSRCTSCNLCRQKCPVLNKPKVNSCISSFALINKNRIERQNSTSGGAFPLLANYVLDLKGIVFGASYMPDFSIRHIAIQDKRDLVLLQGAKYSQSRLDNCFLEIKKQLQLGRMVLFSGTPCQCMGLQSFLGKQYENLINVDVICHGVPAPKVWENYIAYRSDKENDGEKPIHINMRSKVSGWTRYGYCTEFEYKNGKTTHILNEKDLFMQAFISNICLRNSCSDCVAKGLEKCTDLTLGDYWGVWNQHPEFDDNKGTSIVFVHSQKGQSILQQLGDKMNALEVDINEAYSENVSMIKSSTAHPSRNEFISNITKDNFENLVQKYVLSSSKSKLETIKRLVKKIIKFNG